MTHHADRTIDRRQVLGGGVALAALGCLSARAQPVAAHRLTLGEMRITVLSDGVFTLPLGFLLPGRPEKEIAEVLAIDPARIGPFRAAANVVVIETGGEIIVVDAGGGTNFLDGLGKLPDAVTAAGMAPEKVTKVVFTHAHPDHLWGAIDDFDDAPRFANARHIIAAREWDYWIDPATLKATPDDMQGLAAGSRRILLALEKHIDRTTDTASIAPGVTLFPTPGHTPGHVSIHLESKGERLLISGDAIAHPVLAFARPDWPWGSDQNAERGAATRKQTVGMLAKDRIGLISYHLPFPGIGRVEAAGAAWRFVPG